MSAKDRRAGSSRDQPRSKIDWDTVELVGPLSPLPESPRATVAKVRTRVRKERSERAFPERRGRSIVKKLLSGASAKARARGAIYTHVQLRKMLVGLERFIYGWSLVAAAVESTNDFARGVEAAARAIDAASRRLAGLT